MTEHDPEFDVWVDSLQSKAGGTDPLALALRDAVLKERAAEEVRLQPETELAEMRLLARLRREGLLQEPVTRRRTWMIAGLSTAAALLLAVPLGIQMHNNRLSQPSHEILRGSAGTIKVISGDPVATADELLAALRAMGLQPTQTSKLEGFDIQVDVSASDLPKFDPWFASKGGRAVAPGHYRVLVIKGGANEDRQHSTVDSN